MDFNFDRKYWLNILKNAEYVRMGDSDINSLLKKFSQWYQDKQSEIEGGSISDGDRAELKKKLEDEAFLGRLQDQDNTPKAILLKTFKDVLEEEDQDVYEMFKAFQIFNHLTHEVVKKNWFTGVLGDKDSIRCAFEVIMIAACANNLAFIYPPPSSPDKLRGFIINATKTRISSTITLVSALSKALLENPSKNQAIAFLAQACGASISNSGVLDGLQEKESVDIEYVLAAGVQTQFPSKPTTFFKMLTVASVEQNQVMFRAFWSLYEYAIKPSSNNKSALKVALVGLLEELKKICLDDKDIPHRMLCLYNQAISLLGTERLAIKLADDFPAYDACNEVQDIQLKILFLLMLEKNEGYQTASIRDNVDFLKCQDNFKHMVQEWGIDKEYQDDFIMYLIYTNNVVLEDLGQGAGDGLGEGFGESEHRVSSFHDITVLQRKLVKLLHERCDSSDLALLSWLPGADEKTNLEKTA